MRRVTKSWGFYFTITRFVLWALGWKLLLIINNISLLVARTWKLFYFITINKMINDKNCNFLKQFSLLTKMFKKLSTKMLEAFGLLRFAIRPWKFPTSCLEGPQNRHENFQCQMPSRIFSIYYFISYASQNDHGDFRCHYIKTDRPWKFLAACLETLKISMEIAEVVLENVFLRILRVFWLKNYHCSRY